MTAEKLKWTDSIRAVRGKVDRMVDVLDGKAEVVTGTYTGDGTFNQRVIELGFQPSCVILFTNMGQTHENNYVYGGCFFPGYPLKCTYNDPYYAGEIRENGFMVSYSTGSKISTNISNYLYHYIAFR